MLKTGKLIFLFLAIFTTSLFSQIINEIEIIVNNEPITSYDIDTLVLETGETRNKIIDLLVRKSLEQQDADRLRITVSKDELDAYIEKIALAQKMTKDVFMGYVLQRLNMSKLDFYKKIEEQVKQEKLYGTILSSKLERPTENQIKSFYDKNKEMFSVSSSFEVIEYSSFSESFLRKKMMSPIMEVPTVFEEEKTIFAKDLTAEMLKILEASPVQNFTKIIPSQSSYLVYFIKSKGDKKPAPLESVKMVIVQKLMLVQQNRVLQEYFTQLQEKANIVYLK